MRLKSAQRGSIRAEAFTSPFQHEDKNKLPTVPNAFSSRCRYHKQTFQTIASKTGTDNPSHRSPILLSCVGACYYQSLPRVGHFSQKFSNMTERSKNFITRRPAHDDDTTILWASGIAAVICTVLLGLLIPLAICFVKRQRRRRLARQEQTHCRFARQITTFAQYCFLLKIADEDIFSFLGLIESRLLTLLSKERGNVARLLSRVCNRRQ